MTPDKAEQHCADLVKARNRPRFVASLFAPAQLRRGLVALYAFDAELGHIRQVAPEPMIKAMRFQWWRDAVDPVIKADRGHPVLQELATAATAHGLSSADFVALIDAREDAAPDSAVAEIVAVTLAARICGAAGGANHLAERAGAAIALQSRDDLLVARTLWSPARRERKAELPVYLPASFVELRHPVSELALYWRALTKALRNRF